MLEVKLKKRKGTALLVALLIMGVLLAISLALSTLILRETRITKDLLDSGAAYYAAESGIELALYNLNNNLPGWQPEPTDAKSDYKFFDVSDVAVGEFKVKNRCSAYPCLDEEEFDLMSPSSPEVFYDVLDLNESINIPLFIVNEAGNGVKVENFTVEFYAAFDPKNHLDIPFKDLSSWDVLRWKVFGLSEDKGVTESISDFTAFSIIQGGDTEGTFAVRAGYPSWFGTIACGSENPSINCLEYVNHSGIENCDNTHAREYYLYTNGEVGVESCYGIDDFLKNHNLNYLSLTNLINPAVFKDVDKDKASKLYFRVELFNKETAREVADITSNGYSGNSKQSINVQIRRGSFMPVFHFSLYSTYKEAGHDFQYWYGEEE